MELYSASRLTPASASAEFDAEREAAVLALLERAAMAGRTRPSAPEKPRPLDDMLALPQHQPRLWSKHYHHPQWQIKKCLPESYRLTQYQQALLP